MATYTQRTETVTRTIIAVPVPSNWAEVERALAACRDLLSHRDTWDDTVTVEADDTEIRFVITTEGR